MERTIFERNGGFARISRVVSTFYGRVLDSPILAPYFDGIDMRRLMDHQTKFIASIMGGPASYTDEHLARIHERLGIDDRAFEEMTTVLRETLEDHDFSEGDIATVYAEITARRPFIVAETTAVGTVGEA